MVIWFVVCLWLDGCLYGVICLYDLCCRCCDVFVGIMCGCVELIVCFLLFMFCVGVVLCCRCVCLW